MTDSLTTVTLLSYVSKRQFAIAKRVAIGATVAEATAAEDDLERQLSAALKRVAATREESA